MCKWVYMFSEGNASMRNLLGGKGANLAEMTNLGLPIPQGFVVTTEACTHYNNNGKVLSDEIKAQVDSSIIELEKITGKKFGDLENPLLVSVRSGARASMPGMMDTVLNLGLNEEATKTLAKKTNNERFAYDSYRRFIMMYADVVIGVDKHKFERKLDQYKEERNIKSDTEMSGDNWKEICDIFKKIYKDDQGEEFPTDANAQLYQAITAVFRSWDNERANVYRRMHDIPYEWGTAVNVQEMVFGNMGDTSGTGVVFTRDVATGEKKIYGEYMINAQGEDVVAGVRTPEKFENLEFEFPEIYSDFLKIADKLEKHYKDVQDMEVTFENGKLYVLQTRNAKRTAVAALKIAVDLVDEGLITPEEAVLMVDPKSLDQLLHPHFKPSALRDATPIGKGIAASPGAATGKCYFTAEEAEKAVEKGETVVLVRLETSPEDIVGMVVSKGILTARGGMTSHAAVVARGMGRCCVSGCEELKMDEKNKQFTLGGKVFKEGDVISIDGATGKVYGEALERELPEISGDFARFMAWADEIRTLKVRTNADTPKDAKRAVEFGAEGIGLTRTEHMFFEEDRIIKMRSMILADTKEERQKALDALLPYQKDDFVAIYEAMEGLPVTVRLLDPPLHEFLPNTDDDFEVLSKALGKSVDELKIKSKSLHELNPMLGHRGCRLAVSYPEIAVMQTRAILEAAIQVKQEKGYDILPEIMVPFVSDVKEFRFVKEYIVRTADEIIADAGVDLKYLVGTMIEIPRAAITADKIAEEAEFFSFGTNDLTQMTYALSRDDAGPILNDYLENKIFENDPTERLDQDGVGALIEIAVNKGTDARPDIKLGICGESAGDPSTIEFCHRAGLSYVSCSPFRIPIARLSAAQAELKNRLN